MLHSAIEFASAVGAIAAALLWLKSARVKLPSDFPLTVFSMRRDVPGPAQEAVVASGYSPQLDALGRALLKQARLSSHGALMAAVAVILQAVALLAQ